MSIRAPCSCVLGRELFTARDFSLDRGEPSPHALVDFRAFEFGERAGDLEEQLTGRGRGVQVLLLEIEIDAPNTEAPYAPISSSRMHSIGGSAHR
jgi:hypothetical protein